MAVAYGLRRRLAPLRRPARQVVNRPWRLYNLTHPVSGYTSVAGGGRTAIVTGGAVYPIAGDRDANVDEWFAVSGNNRSHHRGLMTGLQLYLNAATGITAGPIMRGWNRASTTWDRAWETEDLIAQNGSGAGTRTYTLATPLAVEVGHHISILLNATAARLNPTAAGNDDLNKRNGSTDTAVVSAVAWDVIDAVVVKSESSNGVVPFVMLVKPPAFVAIGDSWCAGTIVASSAVGFSGVLLPYSSAVHGDDRTKSWPHKLSVLLGNCDYQNMGIHADEIGGGGTFDSRFTADCTAKTPKMVVLGPIGGNNCRTGDALTPATFATTIEADIVANAGRLVVLMGLGPYTSFALDEIQKAERFNYQLRNLASKYRIPFIDIMRLLGKNRTVATIGGSVTSTSQANPCVVTCSGAHGLTATRIYRVRISGVSGSTVANGEFAVTGIDATTFSLQNIDSQANVSGVGAGVGSGGTWELMYYGGNTWDMMAGSEYTGAPDYNGDNDHTTEAGYARIAEYTYRAVMNL